MDPYCPGQPKAWWQPNMQFDMKSCGAVNQFVRPVQLHSQYNYYNTQYQGGQYSGGHYQSPFLYAPPPLKQMRSHGYHRNSGSGMQNGPGTNDMQNSPGTNSMQNALGANRMQIGPGTNRMQSGPENKSMQNDPATGNLQYGSNINDMQSDLGSNNKQDVIVFSNSLQQLSASSTYSRTKCQPEKLSQPINSSHSSLGLRK